MNAEKVSRLAAQDRAMAYWTDPRNFPAPLKKRSFIKSFIGGVFASKLIGSFIK